MLTVVACIAGIFAWLNRLGDNDDDDAGADFEWG